MDITLDQAAALIAVVDEGTIQKAAQKLGKGHSAVMYLIKNLEQATQLSLLDRSGYRNRLTADGETVLAYCRRLLQTKDELARICARLKGGWEPRLNLVYDGVIDFNLITDVLLQLSEDEIPTEIKVSAAHLDEVEQRFADEKADLMLTILPNPQRALPSVKLAPLHLLLVAHKDYGLNRLGRKVTLADLNRHTYVQVRGSTASLGLSTDVLKAQSKFIVNDFFTKKQALLKGLGFGWLPEYMIGKEISSRTLRVLSSAEISSRHILYPRLYHEKKELLGKGAEALIHAFQDKL